MPPSFSLSLICLLFLLNSGGLFALDTNISAQTMGASKNDRERIMIAVMTPKKSYSVHEDIPLVIAVYYPPTKMAGNFFELRGNGRWIGKIHLTNMAAIKEFRYPDGKISQFKPRRNLVIYQHSIRADALGIGKHELVVSDRGKQPASPSNPITFHVTK